MRESCIALTCPNPGNITFLTPLTLLNGLLLVAWLPLSPEAQLKETGFICGNIPYYCNEVGLTDPGPLWRPALAIHQASYRCSSFMHPCCHQGSTVGAVTYSHSRLSWQSSVSLHLGTLKGFRWRGAQGPSLWPSQLAVLGSTFGALFSSWRLHCGTGIPA